MGACALTARCPRHNAIPTALPGCCSKDIKVCGLLGPASPLERKGPQVSDQAVGLGGTTAWKLCTLASSTTVAVVFDIGERAGARGEQEHHSLQGGSLAARTRCLPPTLTRS